MSLNQAVNISRTGQPRYIIAKRGNLQQKALYKGNDLIAKYKVENPINTDAANTLNTNTATNIDTNMSPDDWMKKLLSSEDSGVELREQCFI